MKHFKVLLDDRHLGEVPTAATATVANLKDYGKSVIKYNKKNSADYLTDIYLEPKNKLDLSQIKDELVLGPYFHLFTDPHLHIRHISNETNFMDLPSDMKKYLINFVEPNQALELCKTVKCNWEHLLNINYDFVTQGFAPGNSAEEKFKYLAARVSKNINLKDTPDIIFIHFSGIPLGKQRFSVYSNRDQEDEDAMRETIEYRRETRDVIIGELSKHPAVEWLRQDDHNVWVKVIRDYDLPYEFEGKLTGIGDVKHRQIWRDIDTYDYPSVRANVVRDFTEQEYPGNIDINIDVLKSMIRKLAHVPEYEGDELNSDSINQDAEEYMREESEYDAIPEYNVYTMMRDGFTRSEAEAFTRAIFKSGNFSQNLEEMYDFDVDEYFPE